MGQAARIYVNGRFLQQTLTGVQRYGLELVKAWDRMLANGEIDGRKVEFQILAPRGPIRAPRLARIPIRQAGRLRGHLWTQLELPFLARDGLLFSPGNIHPLLSLGRFHGVVTVHDLGYIHYPAAFSRAFRLLYSIAVPAALRRANAVITVSEAEKANILARHPAVRERIHVIHHGAPDGAPDGVPRGMSSGMSGGMSGREAEGAGADPQAPAVRERIPSVLWVGTPIPRKNPQALLDAVARINRKTPLNLVAVGAGSQGLVEQGLTIAPEIRHRIDLRGRLESFADVRHLYQSASALVFPSFYEGFGFPPLEAMRFGCPVIASDIPVLHEICADAALYADPRRPADIAEKIGMLLEDEGLRHALIQSGLRRAALFTWEKSARKTLAVLEDVLGFRRQAGCDLPDGKMSPAPCREVAQ